MHLQWHLTRSMEETSPFESRESKGAATLLRSTTGRKSRGSRPIGFAKDKKDIFDSRANSRVEEDLRDFQRNLKIYEKVRRVRGV